MKKSDDIFPLVTVQQALDDWEYECGLTRNRKLYPTGGLLKDYEEPEKIKSESESNSKETKTK